VQAFGAGVETLFNEYLSQTSQLSTNNKRVSKEKLIRMKAWLEGTMATRTAKEASEKCWTKANFLLRDGLVYRQQKGNTPETLVVDESTMYEKILEVHDSVGHGSSYRTIARTLRSQYYGITELDVSFVREHCQICNQ